MVTGTSLKDRIDASNAQYAHLQDLAAQCSGFTIRQDVVEKYLAGKRCLYTQMGLTLISESVRAVTYTLSYIIRERYNKSIAPKVESIVVDMDHLEEFLAFQGAANHLGELVGKAQLDLDLAVPALAEATRTLEALWKHQVRPQSRSNRARQDRGALGTVATMSMADVVVPRSSTPSPLIARLNWN